MKYNALIVVIACYGLFFGSIILSFFYNNWIIALMFYSGLMITMIAITIMIIQLKPKEESE